MKRYIEIKTDYELNYTIKDLDKNYGLKNLGIPYTPSGGGVLLFVDIIAPKGEIIRLEAPDDIMEKFLKEVHGR